MQHRNIVLKYGIITALILIVYFLFLGFLDLNSNPMFSFANAPISAVGIALAIRDFKSKTTDGITYKDGYIVGLSTGTMATILFTLVFITYYSYNEQFSQELLDFIGMGMGAGLLFSTVFIMGLATTLISTFALMQLNKKSWNPKKEQDLSR